MYLLITVMASLLVGLVLVYLVHVVFEREPSVPGSTRAGRRAVKRNAALEIELLNRELDERDRMIAELSERQSDRQEADQ